MTPSDPGRDDRGARTGDAAAPDLPTLAASVRRAQRQLGAAPAATRDAVLDRLAELLEARQAALLEANAQDLEQADRAGLTGPLRHRLALSEDKLATLVTGVRQLRHSPDPIGAVVRHTELDEGLVLRQVKSPLGVLLIIFESRPDAVIQIGSLALRSGNGVLLKGGAEALRSNRALVACLRDALAAEGLASDAVAGVEGREAVQRLLELDEHIDLVIPRGSGALVRSIQSSTRIPVLGHAEGICHLVLDAAADPDRAARLAVDGKCDYPAACNATETLLVHQGFLDRWLIVARALLDAGVTLRADEAARQALGDLTEAQAEADPGAVGGPRVLPATDADGDTEYGDLTLAVRTVDDLDAAIDWIHAHGSGHTDAIATEDRAAAERFLREVDSASVFVNASTRFADGYRYGLGAEVGIATGRIHARGPVGVDGLLTTRWLLEGEGHVAADYGSGEGKRRFTHRRLGSVWLAPLLLSVALPLLLALLGATGLGACHWDGGGDDDDILGNWNGVPMEVDPECTSARLTQYWSTTWGWCEFPSDRSFLPDFVQDGITLAIAEPWAGGSYGGALGEACGECWEISTSFATQVVMVHDLCPIEGNPLCAGVHFHLDLTPEAAEAVQGGGNDAAAARRVPCPVTGNIHAAILDWNQWGYLRLSFMNHRIAIREAEARAEPGGQWMALERSGGAWHLPEGPGHDSGDGLVFRLTSAQGQVVEGDRVVPFQQVSPGHDNVVTVDLGLQVDDLEDPPAGQCLFVPDGQVYGDRWGGIDQVRWTPLEWDGADVRETDQGCHTGDSCLRASIEKWSGFHLYLRQAFPADTFSALQLWVCSETAGTTLNIAPSYEGERCTEQSVTLDTDWQQVTFDLQAACAALDLLTSVTVQNTTDRATVWLDEIEYVQ